MRIVLNAPLAHFPPTPIKFDKAFSRQVTLTINDSALLLAACPSRHRVPPRAEMLSLVAGLVRSAYSEECDSSPATTVQLRRNAFARSGIRPARSVSKQSGNFPEAASAFATQTLCAAAARPPLLFLFGS